jgi:hypothetical protein
MATRTGMANRWILISTSFVAVTTACSLIAPSDSEFLKPPSTAGTGGGGAAASGGTNGGGNSGQGGTNAGGSAGAGASQGAGGSSAGGSGGSAGVDAGTDGGVVGSAGTAGDGGTGGGGGTSADGGVGGGDDGSSKGGTGGLAGSGGSGGGATSLPVSGMVLWLTAMQGVVRSGSSVSLWEDQSVFGNDAIQSSPSSRPEFGGHWRSSTVDFDGYDDFFILPASASFADFSGGFSAFFAAESHGGGPCQSLIQFSNGAGKDEILVHRETEGDFVYQAPSGLARCRGNAMPVDEPVLVSVVHAGTEASLYVDGLFCAGGAVGALANVVKNSATIGRAAHPSCARFSGHIGEIIVYNRALNAQERMVVDQHLQTRWDL